MTEPTIPSHPDLWPDAVMRTGGAWRYEIFSSGKKLAGVSASAGLETAQRVLAAIQGPTAEVPQAQPVWTLLSENDTAIAAAQGGLISVLRIGDFGDHYRWRWQILFAPEVWCGGDDMTSPIEKPESLGALQALVTFLSSDGDAVEYHGAGLSTMPSPSIQFPEEAARWAAANQDLLSELTQQLEEGS